MVYQESLEVSATRINFIGDKHGR